MTVAQAIKLMSDYFYSSDGFSNSLQLHAAIYAVAEYYNVPGLEKLAAERFAEAAPAI